MPAATIFSLLILWLNLSISVAHFAISRAPGWRLARVFGFIALSAACYGLGNTLFVLDGLPVSWYVAGARWNYFWAVVHIVAWFPYAFGGPDGRWSAMPRAIRRIGEASLALAVLFAWTGWQVRQAVTEIPVPWAGLTYHYALNTPLGDAYSLASVLLLVLPLVQFERRRHRGEKDLGLVVAGFAIFALSGLVEVAVANRWLVTVSPAELGFLAIVAPTALRTLRRFIADARTLSELSGRLAGEVRERTEERDRAESALVESERLAALGRLAAGVGHEINNPLTYLQLSLDRLDRHLPSAEAREALGHARDGARRIEKVVEGLRTYSRRHGERRAVDPAAVVRAALQVANPHLRHVARIDVAPLAAPPVLGDEPRLVQALVNLLANAAQAVAGRPSAGRIEVGVRAGAGGEVVLEVADDGSGVPEDMRAHLAEPYFTTRAPEGGLGLGLFVTRGIVDAHGGRLEIVPREGGGTIARIVLPALGGAGTGTTEALASPAGAAAAPVAVAGVTRSTAAPPGRRVLVVDDEPLVLSLLVGVLGRRWETRGAASAAEALTEIEAGDVGVIVCDLMMPGMSGMELAERVESLDPALRARMLFLTGGVITPEAEAFVARADVLCLPKPLDLASLESLLAARLDPGSAAEPVGSA